MTGYSEDLAYIHDVDATHSLICAPGILQLLNENEVKDGLVAHKLRQIGFRVRTLRGYGDFRFAETYNGYTAILGRKW